MGAIKSPSLSPLLNLRSCLWYFKACFESDSVSLYICSQTTRSGHSPRCLLSFFSFLCSGLLAKTDLKTKTPFFPKAKTRWPSVRQHYLSPSPPPPKKVLFVNLQNPRAKLGLHDNLCLIQPFSYETPKLGLGGGGTRQYIYTHICIQGQTNK